MTEIMWGVPPMTSEKLKAESATNTPLWQTWLANWECWDADTSKREAEFLRKWQMQREQERSEARRIYEASLITETRTEFVHGSWLTWSWKR